MVVDSSSECWLSGTLASFSTSIHLGGRGAEWCEVGPSAHDICTIHIDNVMGGGGEQSGCKVRRTKSFGTRNKQTLRELAYFVISSGESTWKQ